MEHIWQSVYKEMEIAPEDVRQEEESQITHSSDPYQQ